jgi:hypothetical protein
MEGNISSTEKQFSNLLDPEKLSFIIEGEIKTFHDKQKLKQLITTYQHSRRYSKKSYKMKINIDIKVWE